MMSSETCEQRDESRIGKRRSRSKDEDQEPPQPQDPPQWFERFSTFPHANKEQNAESERGDQDLKPEKILHVGKRMILAMSKRKMRTKEPLSLRDNGPPQWLGRFSTFPHANKEMRTESARGNRDLKSEKILHVGKRKIFAKSTGVWGR